LVVVLNDPCPSIEQLLVISKQTKEHKRMKAYYRLHIVYLLQVSATHTVIFRKMHYKR